MNRMTIYSLLMTLPILLGLSSCSSLPKNSVAVEEKKVEGEKVVAREVSSEPSPQQQFEKIIADAQAAGPLAVQYLSTDLYLKANDSASRGDLQTSVFLLEYVSKLNPNDLFVKKKWAIELIRTGQLEQAENLLVEVTKHGDDEILDLILGGVYTARDKIKEARAVYKSVMKRYPASEEACIFLAKSYMEGQEVEKAIELLDGCEKTVKAPIFPYYRGKVAVDQGQPKQARVFFQRALKLDPEYHQAVMAIGLIEESEQNYEAARKVYENFLTLRPNSYPVLSRLVQILFAMEKYNEIIPYAEVLASLDPSDLNLKVRLGILYTDAKKYEQAIETFKSVLEVIPDSDKVLYYLGSLFQQTQNYTEALHHYGMIPSESPLFHDGHLQMATMLHALAQENSIQNEQEFLSFLDEKSKENTDLFFDFMLMKTTYFESQNRFEDSVKSLSLITDEERFSEGHKYYLATLFEKKGDQTKSLALIREILAENPDHAHALNFLGYTMLEKNENLAEAYVLIKKAVSLKPDDGYIRDSLGWYYYKTGNLQKALTEIKAAHQLVEADMVVSKHLAIVYRELQDYDNARKFFMEALSHCRLDSEKNLVMEAMEQMESKRLPASAAKP